MSDWTLNEYDAARLWNAVHRGTGHVAAMVERNPAARAYDVRCSCQRVGHVSESVDGGLYVSDGDRHDKEDGQRLGARLVYADGRERVLQEYVWVSKIIEPHESGGVRTFERIDERDEKGRRIFVERAVDRQENVQMAQHDQERRFRAAMQGMATFMLSVRKAVELAAQDYKRFAAGQRLDAMAGTMGMAKSERERGSFEWSRRVREGVKALRPPGPVVAVRGDWEDD